MLKDASIIETPHGKITGEILVTFTDDKGLPRNVTVTDVALANEIAVTPPIIPNPARVPLDKEVIDAAIVLVEAAALAAVGEVNPEEE